MPCPKIFCAGPIFFKPVQKFNSYSKTFVHASLLNGNHLWVWHKMFGNGKKCVTTFGLSKKVLKPIERQGISLSIYHPESLNSP